MTITRFVALLSIPAIAACAAKQPPPRFVRAEPIKEDPPKPAIVEVAKPVPIPGQLKRLSPPTGPKARRGAVAKMGPSEIIRDANRKATASPDPDGYFNAIATFEFEPGTLYQIYAAPQKLTDIQLQPGERLVGKPAIGDNIRWVLARGTSAAGGIDQEHLYIKPTRPDLDTTLCINTDRRSYILELHSYEDAGSPRSPGAIPKMKSRSSTPLSSGSSSSPRRRPRRVSASTS